MNESRHPPGDLTVSFTLLYSIEEGLTFVNTCTGLALTESFGEPSPKSHQNLAIPVMSFVNVTVAGVHALDLS